MTRGSEGAVAVSDGSGRWPAATVEHSGFDIETVDTTGAGDAFVAGAITALRDGRDLADAVAFANAVAARATTGRGAMTALPTRDAVAPLLERE